MDRLGRALVLLYISPTVGPERFGAEVKKVLSEYDVQVMVDDLMHGTRLKTNWCTANDTKKKGM